MPWARCSHAGAGELLVASGEYCRHEPSGRMGTMVGSLTDGSDHIVPLVFDEVVTLPRRANVVIIGGGVMGTSIAFHLAEAGVRDIVVIERDTLGSGSSAKPL